MQPLLRLLLLTGQRKSEVANTQWFEFDLDKRIWIIPAGRMKAGAAHVVPLSDGVIDCCVACHVSIAAIICSRSHSGHAP